MSEGCSHVAAIMFKVEYAVRNGYTATTSSLCRWNQIFTKRVLGRLSHSLFCYSHRFFNKAKLTYALPYSVYLFFCVQHEPARILDIKILQPKRVSGGSCSQSKHKRINRERAAPTFEEQKAFLKSVQSLFPDSAILNVTTLKMGPCSNMGTMRKLTPMITSLSSPEYRNKTDEELYGESEHLLI